MTKASGSGHVERIGRNWYLRRRESVAGAEGGKPTQKQNRVRLGSTRDIRSQAKAREVADAWLARIAAPTLEPGIATTFREYSEKFIRDQVALFREGSRRRYRSSIALLQTSLGNEALSAIDAPRLQTTITELSADRAPATVKTLRAVALQILRRARVDRFGAHVIESREIKLPRPSAPAVERQSWNEAQLEQIIAASYPPWSVLWGVMGYAGLRAGEAFALTWADVDLHQRTLRIRGNATRQGITAPKTARSAATVPMLPRVEQLLTAYLPVWRENAAGLLFAGRTGRPLIADDVRTRKLKPTLAQLALPAAGLHSFRHSTHGILSALGLNLESISLYLRHSNISMTARYMHLSADQLSEAVRAAVARRVAVQTSANGPQA